MIEFISDKVSMAIKKFWFKYLVHMVGIVHLSLHFGIEEDWGGNKIDVYGLIMRFRK